MRRLEGKIAVITGGSSGIGLASAKAFLKEGATVIIVGRDQKALDATNNVLDGQAFVVKADISKMEDLEYLYTRVKEKFSRIDILFANAGVVSFTPMEKTTTEVFDTIFDINVKGTYFTVQKAIPLLAKGASVILTTSIANQFGKMNISAYAASKAAVRSLAQSFAAELVGQGVRVNAISPGTTETPIFGKHKSLDQVKAMFDNLKETAPMKRITQAEDIAKVALFMASDESMFLLGQEVVVDGGSSSLVSSF